MPTYLHWFRRDLRLHDNPALDAALRASEGRVVPLFILDEAILRAPDTGAARVVFLLESLRALDSALRAAGSRLIIRRGKPAEVLAELAQQSDAAGLCFNRDYLPAARTRDTEVEAALGGQGLAVISYTDAVIYEAETILSKAGTPYTVYPPYWKQWRARVAAEPPVPATSRPALAPVPNTIESLAIPSARELGFTTDQELPPGGESAGLARLAGWCRLDDALGIGGYRAGRERPALRATSGLSPYLRFGCVAPRACLRAALQALEQTNDQRPTTESGRELGGSSPVTAHSSSIETWLSELAWRDFYHQILVHFPHVLESAFKRNYDALEWENDERLFAAWCTGHTGYPIVDAAMRQLNREAWMHNRARMIVASFLTKDLLIDWRWGEQYFMRQLVDGDHAANNGGWQWAAGTSPNAQPYFRIFNPTSQGQKFDPRGEYVRRYLPELANVPDRYIHKPWSMPEADQRRAGIRIGHDYPAPLVDHAIQRERALAMYRAVRLEA
jgi:deoxyribodipyrimidine photo-lyase